MANAEHVSILERGTKAWNTWRNENPDILPDLSDVRHLILEDLSGAIFYGAKMSGSVFIGDSRKRVIFRDIDLRGADFQMADLRGAVLGANLKNANLRKADMSGAVIMFSTFWHTNLQETNFEDVNLSGSAFIDVDLSTAKNLDSIEHLGPSTVSLDTIYKSGANISDRFLRGCGVSESFITYRHSLVGKAIEFYSCFISFTEADDTFSERLYNDMQAAGVRCWRWKEDAKWGRTLMRSIDEAVRVYDKLVVICSEQSLNSPAVIREIERALQKEDDAAREGKEGEVLFPIRLDDFIFAGWEHHRKADVVAKNVGDFRRWTEPVEYKKAFERLMRDLKAGERL